MKMRSPHTIGVAEPRPGSFTFHFTLLVSLHVVGGFADGATPVASGPRHCGQFGSGEAAASEMPRHPTDNPNATRDDRNLIMS
jgi:hypothetical protein